MVADSLSVEDSKLKNALAKSNIGMIVSLSTGKFPANRTIAYLIIGTKKSGNIYNKQDIKIVEIIADELLIAIQNALRFEEIQGFAARLQSEVNQATAKLQNLTSS